MFFSIIVPAFSRKGEVEELFESLTLQNYKAFEIILADATPDKELFPVVEQYANKLNIKHLHQPFLRISPSRNMGAKEAKGDFFLFFDSDCIIPPQYLTIVSQKIIADKIDAYGGPDAANPSFTPVQKAISYSMTSLWTTGGIRGRNKHVGKFHPRGFNMGISKPAFDSVGGYGDLKCAEDIDLSIRLINKGYHVVLIPEAFVYHKRRTDFHRFFKQIFRFGSARVDIYKMYPKELKITHLFPVAFLFGLFFWVLSPLFYFPVFLVFSILWLFYFFLIFVSSTLQNSSVYIGFLSIVSTLTQMTAYGLGFLNNFTKRVLLNQQPKVNTKKKGPESPL